jgi:hypothetical protein
MAYREIQIPPGSSNVERVEYDPETGTLLVTFQRGGARYSHDGVPGTVADGFTTSGLSAGKYYNMAIRGQYPYQQVG